MLQCNWMRLNVRSILIYVSSIVMKTHGLFNLHSSPFPGTNQYSGMLIKFLLLFYLISNYDINFKSSTDMYMICFWSFYQYKISSHSLIQCTGVHIHESLDSSSLLSPTVSVFCKSRICTRIISVSCSISFCRTSFCRASFSRTSFCRTSFCRTRVCKITVYRFKCRINICSIIVCRFGCIISVYRFKCRITVYRFKCRITFCRFKCRITI